MTQSKRIAQSRVKRARTVIVNSGSPGAWHGTSATASATTVACANDAEVFDRLLGAPGCHELIYGRRMGLVDALGVCVSPHSTVPFYIVGGVDSLPECNNAESKNCTGAAEMKAENAETPPLLPLTNCIGNTPFAAVTDLNANLIATRSSPTAHRSSSSRGIATCARSTHAVRRAQYQTSYNQWHRNQSSSGAAAEAGSGAVRCDRAIEEAVARAQKGLLFVRHPQRFLQLHYVSNSIYPPQVPATSYSNFDTIFAAALEAYKRQTKKDITSHPLATRLQSCGSPSAILSILRAQVQVFDQSQVADDKLTKWLDPTVNVLYAFSAILGEGVGLTFPPAKAIFAGIGVLLQAVKDVHASQNALVDLFSRMEYFFMRLEKYIDVRPTAAMTDIIVKIMVEVISILGIVTKEIRQGRTMRYLKKLIGRKDVEDALQRLDKLTQEEARMAGVEALAISRGIDERVRSVNNKVDSVTHGIKENGAAIQQVVNQVSDINRNELHKDLRKWVAPPDPSVNYNTASGAHHEGTAEWCTKGNTLANWKTSGSLLWIHGKPGSGKSILSSAIIQDIKPLSNVGSAFLAYFYFDFKDKAKQDSRALLSSLLVQLSDQSDIFCDALYSLYSGHKQGSEQPTSDSLSQCLKYMLTTAGPVPIYLILDALDECPYGTGLPSPREKLLDLVDELVKLRLPTLRLCITSRPEFDIRTALEPLATQQVSLHNEGGQKQDINNYVTDVVRSDRRMKRWREEEKDMVIEKLTEKADGMFRWVYCQLEVLRYCFPTDVRRVLEELPKSLDETYKRILEGISNANRDHSYRLLQCLTVALRPLRVEELAELLAIDLKAGGIPKLNTDWRWEDQEEAVLSACSSLVTVIVDDGSRVVQFSHFSVKEFLTSDRLAGCTEEVSRFHIATEPSHMILVQACLGALLSLDDHTKDEDEDEDEDGDGASAKNTFVRYAAEYWVGHAQVGNVETRIKDAMDYFFNVDSDKPYFRTWVRIHDIDASWRRNATLTSASPLYYAAFCGFHSLVNRLIDKHPQHVNAQGGGHGTPLDATLFNGHIEVAQLLRERGADVNILGAYKRTPLHIVSEYGHLAAAKWLLDSGADVNSLDHYGWTPLHFATVERHLEVARILIEHNAEVDSRDVSGYTSLIVASFNDIPDIMRCLLDHNADAYVRDNKGNTPLHFAVHSGHLEISQILLERNAEVNTQNDEGSTPLHLASEGYVEYSEAGGYPDVVQLLLDHGADAQLRNLSGMTASEVARGPEEQEIIRLLSQHAARRTNETGYS
ncbi:hypothetical protein EDB84DRAFT_1578712 [Lactarius hengduanensis]|nr:hypothetical protein EDB84DRAFT_1578712 [Lactarius hengduanensis]